MLRTLLRALIGRNSDLQETEARTNLLMHAMESEDRWRLIFLPLATTIKERIHRIHEKRKLTP